MSSALRRSSIIGDHTITNSAGCSGHAEPSNVLQLAVN